MSRFGNKITPDEVIPSLDATEQEISLFGGDVRRKQKRGGTSGMGLSRKLSKRKCRPGSSDLPNESQSKKILRRLRRAMTTMKEVERRVEEMTSSSTAMKLETARMRDEAIRARDEAFIARDEAHRLRDEAEGLNAEASMAKADACRLRDEATAFCDEAERIYADIAAVKDDYERGRGGYPFEGDEAMSLSTDSSNWSDEDYLYEEVDSSSVEEVATAFDVVPLCVERPIDGVATLFNGLEVGDNSGLVANDGNDVSDDGVAYVDVGDGVGEEGEGRSEMPYRWPQRWGRWRGDNRGYKTDQCWAGG